MANPCQIKILKTVRFQKKASLFILMKIYHPADKTDQQCGADEYYQIGRKKGHDKAERVFQLISGDKKIDSKN